MTFGIVMIATNNYLNLWKKAISSLLENNSEFADELTTHLFTDDPAAAELFWKHQAYKSALKVYKIPSYVWPEATLLRYEIIDSQKDALEEDVLIYLDSDMLVSDKFIHSLAQLEWTEPLAVVVHPGFYRPSKGNRLRERLMNPYLLIQDLKFLLRFGQGFGSWETNPESRAFVNSRLRKVYVHGAIWMGSNSSFKELVLNLSREVREDYDKGLIAKWHDESHLNAWITKRAVTILPPTYSWYSEYQHLKHFSPLVESMNKSQISFERVTQK
jgi:hypothetical protein